MLRHAEKANDGTKDPGLSVGGQAFATKLTRVFAEIKIDAVYSTPYKRTIQTVLPLAVQNKLSVLNYEPAKSADLLKNIINPGLGVIVVAGHSNTVDLIFNSVIQDQPIKALSETEYNTVFIITYDPKDPAKVLLLSLILTNDGIALIRLS